jgi:hypothetical protein
MKMLRKIARSVAKEIPWRSHCTVTGIGATETEVRDLIVPVHGILGLAVVQNPMRTRQTDEKQLQIERRTIVKPTLQIRYYLLVGGVVIVETDCATLIESASLTVFIVAVEKHLHHAMIVREGTGMTNGRGHTEEEVTPGEALMTYLMVMKNLVVAGVEGLTVILKVRAAEEILRFVAFLRVVMPTIRCLIQGLEFKLSLPAFHDQRLPVCGAVPLLCI